MSSTCTIIATIIIGITIYLTVRTRLMTTTMHAINEGILTKKFIILVMNTFSYVVETTPLA